MPAGSGPMALALSAVAVGTAETVVATLPPQNWNNPDGLGNLVEFTGTLTPPATGGTLVLKIRQGTTTGGTQVGPTISLPVTASTVTPAAISAIDSTAFGNLQLGGQYVLTAQYAAATGSTLTGVLTLETIAPLI